ncbi:fasciclin domain-containing protein [Formosa haliotis]|uniref:fasciclin domain-containing protein n=1 Tax=Formosa haliotis TaxID=1555194 RepID=UPI0008261C99|nr:fasciclin domain-containing protein [Formosa haliotis]
MKKIIPYYLLCLPLFFFLANCSRDEVDEYYARPDDLEPPIYQQLETEGNFQNLIKLIEIAGYKDILGKAGYWTLMAPNDDAFTSFFKEQGVSDISQVDTIIASKIVKYALIYNAFRTERLSDYQSNIGWEVDLAFRRRTAYYDGFEKRTINGSPMVVVGSNRNNVEGGDYYIPGDNNNKYVSYFTEEYMNAASLGSYDYNYFFKDEIYTGFNVLNSEVVQADIVAENGIIHEVNKVILPPLNLDQKIEQSSDYSLFYEMLEDNLISYNFDQEATTTYRNYTRNSDDVYIKVYDPTLSFSPNNENFLKATDNDGQSDAYTLIVPNNESLQIFVDEILLNKYSSLGELPKYIYQDFFNAHMIQAAVWPSKVSGYSNALEEDIRIDMDTDVVEAEILSNGFFYGTSRVQESNLFYSVYTSAYLDPGFTLATRLFNDGSGYREIISNIYSDYTLFLPSDEVLMDLGYNYDINRSEWVFVSPETGNEVRGSLARARILRILYNGIVPTPNMELNDLSGSGIIRSGDFDLPGEYIKWNNNQVFAAGNEVLENTVNILGYEDKENGRTYYIDKLLEFSEEFQGVDLAEIASEPDSKFAFFFEFLKNSGLYDEASGAIDGIELGTPFTFVIPSNDAIKQAVMDGVLPGDTLTGEPNFVPADDTIKDEIANFVKYHFLTNRTASDDGLINGLTETLLKTEFGEKTYVNIVSAVGDLSFIDSSNRIATYIPLESNHLADRTLIHLVDNYLFYTE